MTYMNEAQFRPLTSVFLLSPSFSITFKADNAPTIAFQCCGRLWVEIITYRQVTSMLVRFLPPSKRKNKPLVIETSMFHRTKGGNSYYRIFSMLHNFTIGISWIFNIYEKSTSVRRLLTYSRLAFTSAFACVNCIIPYVLFYFIVIG